jgi:hypothetical protein
MRSVNNDNHLKAMIESMSRAGYSEREIVNAVQRASGRSSRDEPAASSRAVDVVRRAFTWRVSAG